MSADALSSFDTAAPHYPDVDRTVIAAARSSPRGMSTGAHSHDRAQFVFAIRGLMVATTEIRFEAIGPRQIHPPFSAGPLWRGDQLERECDMAGSGRKRPVRFCTSFALRSSRL
jgi:hypothetical protein